MAVANQLDLDVTRFFNKLFDEDTVVAKAVTRFVTATAEAFKRFLVIEGHAQALATAAGTGLDHHGVTNALGNLNGFFRRLDRVIDARNTVHACGASQLLGLDLVAHGGNGVVLGADEDDALFFHPFGKTGVLAQKAVTRMHRLGAGLLAGGDDFFSLQIAVAAGRGTDVNGLVGQRHMACVLVSVGVNRHGLDAHLAGSEDDAAGDFAAVGDQDFGEHSYLLTLLGQQL